MDNQTIDERLGEILHSYREGNNPWGSGLETAKAAIRQLVLDSLPGEPCDPSTWALGYGSCLSSIKQSWEPIKAQIMNHLPPIKSKHIGCLCCPGSESCLPMDTTLYSGFGGWSITCDDELWFRENSETEWEHCRTLQDIETTVQASPNHDWRAVLDAPLRGAVYQRQNGKWLLIEENEGFA